MGQEEHQDEVRGVKKGKVSDREKKAEGIHPVHGHRRRNQFLIWPSEWQSWCTPCYHGLNYTKLPLRKGAVKEKGGEK